MALLLYCGSRLVAAYRQKTCVSFLGLKYYRSNSAFYYWLGITAHGSILVSTLTSIVRDLRQL